MNKEFPSLLQLSIKDHLLHMGFTERLINELVQATAVVNYGQDVNIESFVGLISIAGADANLWSVKGGNKAVIIILLLLLYLDYVCEIYISL